MPDERKDVRRFRSDTHEWHVNQTLLAVLVVLLVVGALRITAPVALPLAFAVFLIAVVWPLQRRLERHLAGGLAAVVSLAALLGVVALFLWGLYESAEMVVEKAPEYAPKLENIVERIKERAARLGLPAGGSGSYAPSLPVEEWAGRVVQRLTTFSGSFVLVIAFFVLGLLEVRDFRWKMGRIFDNADGQALLDSIDRIARDFMRYIVVRTGVGLVTGLLVGLFCLLIGLDFAMIWGLLNFLLNYIPTLGSIVAVVPPTLFALVSFTSPVNALLVLAGVGGIQLVMGQYVDPLVQGRYLSLSPLVVLLSVAFWGWLWGIAGAFISIPITVAIVITCEQFDRTRWIAVMLADVDVEDEPDSEDA